MCIFRAITWPISPFFLLKKIKLSHDDDDDNDDDDNDDDDNDDADYFNSLFYYFWLPSNVKTTTNFHILMFLKGNGDQNSEKHPKNHWGVKKMAL